MTTQSFRTASFMIHKKLIQDIKEVIKQVREGSKLSDDLNFKESCIQMIFEARQIQAKQIESAKKDYPFIDWTKYA